MHRPSSPCPHGQSRHGKASSKGFVPLPGTGKTYCYIKTMFELNVSATMKSPTKTGIEP
jgi:hypothetical protein